LKIPARRAEYSLTENVASPFQAKPRHIEEIMLKIGYDDVRSFRRLFRALTDLSPKAYRRKYGAHASQIAARRAALLGV